MDPAVLVGMLLNQVAIPVAVVAGTVLVLSRTSLGRAVIDRLRGPATDDARFDVLAGELDRLREQVTDVQERLDFTERMLTQVRERQLPRDAGASDRS